MLQKEERDLIKLSGRYTYYKMKDLGLPLTIESYKEYLDKLEKEKRLKKKIGTVRFAKMKELKLTYKDFIQYEKEQKLKKYERKREKDKIRFKTIRYVERYCNINMKCQICEAEKRIEIHHPNYNDYLKINLLCKKHHNQLHNFELVPPQIIDLEKIAIKKPAQKEKQEYVKLQIENIKKDILLQEFTYSKLSKKYEISTGTIRRYLEKEENWNTIQTKLIENGEKNGLVCKLKHQDNPLQKYRIKHKLTIAQISNITQIPVPTLRAIECGKTKLSKIKPKTKNKLKTLKEVI